MYIYISIYYCRTMAEVKSRIAQWYNGRSVFITGGSGFMGKVMVEKLLYSCSGIKNIYIYIIIIIKTKYVKKAHKEKCLNKKLWNKKN